MDKKRYLELEEEFKKKRYPSILNDNDEKGIIQRIINDAVIFASRNKIENLDEYKRMLEKWKEFT